MTRNPNMDNQIALLWRENVRKLCGHYNMPISQLAPIVGRGVSTMQNVYGGTGTTKKQGYATPEHIAKIEKAFRLPTGSLTKPNFNPVTVPSELPDPNPHPPQMATLSIPIPQEKMERIMRILEE